jgi:hypothetical protein
VLVTLFVALPIYSQVASHSPHGQGSILMLEELLPRWKGKAFVLVLLGFAFTDFIITITLSAADATVHLIENPLTPDFLHGNAVIITAVEAHATVGEISDAMRLVFGEHSETATL